MLSVNQSIEQSPHKNNVRMDIINAQVARAISLSKRTIKILTLPGETCSFEKQLISACSPHGITVIGDCCELNPQRTKIWHKMKLNLPKELSPHNVDIMSMNFSQYDLIWLDFCGFPNDARIQATIDAIGARDVGTVYVTFQVVGSHYRGGNEGLIKQLDSKSMTVPDATVAAITRKIKSAKLKNVHPIMDIRYLGGESEKVDMLTLGFQTGKTKIIPCLVENRIISIREARKANKDKNTCSIVDKYRKKNFKKRSKGAKKAWVTRRKKAHFIYAYGEQVGTMFFDIYVKIEKLRTLHGDAFKRVSKAIDDDIKAIKNLK